jgi:hypothetical protein
MRWIHELPRRRMPPPRSRRPLRPAQLKKNGRSGGSASATSRGSRCRAAARQGRRSVVAPVAVASRCKSDARRPARQGTHGVRPPGASNPGDDGHFVGPAGRRRWTHEGPPDGETLPVVRGGRCRGGACGDGVRGIGQRQLLLPQIMPGRGRAAPPARVNPQHLSRFPGMATKGGSLLAESGGRVVATHPPVASVTMEHGLLAANVVGKPNTRGE